MSDSEIKLSVLERIRLGQTLREVEQAIAFLQLHPQPHDERLEELRQQYEAVLGLLESEFLGALVTGNWNEFDRFVNEFRSSRI